MTSKESMTSKDFAVSKRMFASKEVIIKNVLQEVFGVIMSVFLWDPLSLSSLQSGWV